MRVRCVVSTDVSDLKPLIGAHCLRGLNSCCVAMVSTKQSAQSGLWYNTRKKMLLE
jgi:hypothetical protein